jgi:hypothetical protein
VLEAAGIHREAVAARYRRHAGVRLDATHHAAACGEQPGGDSSAATNIEHARDAGSHQIVEQRRRIAGPRPVVLPRIGAEGLGPLAVIMLPGHGSPR